MMNRMTPAANISASNPVYCPCYIYGGLYPYVPTFDFKLKSPLSPFESLANPKSDTLRVNYLSNSIFYGFKSR